MSRMLFLLYHIVGLYYIRLNTILLIQVLLKCQMIHNHSWCSSTIYYHYNYGSLPKKYFFILFISNFHTYLISMILLIYQPFLKGRPILCSQRNHVFGFADTRFVIKWFCGWNLVYPKDLIWVRKHCKGHWSMLMFIGQALLMEQKLFVFTWLNLICKLVFA